MNEALFTIYDLGRIGRYREVLKYCLISPCGLRPIYYEATKLIHQDNMFSLLHWDCKISVENNYMYFNFFQKLHCFEKMRVNEIISPLIREYNGRKY